MSSVLQEPARTLPVFGDYDVVVVGDETGGIAAAVSAAKHGARTLLVGRCRTSAGWARPGA